MAVVDEAVSLAAGALPASTIAVALALAVNLVVHVALRLRKPAADEDPALFSGKTIPALQWTRQHLLALTREFIVLTAILLYVWVCENAPIHEHGQKEHIPDFFWFICLMILLFAFGSLEHDPKSNDLVNRDQSEEWKGWMQTVFLLYHYFHANEVYNSVRVMISCYVWMTGFGNFSFFYIKQDYGFVRFAQMMWRLNFTVLFLCLVMNNMYMLYYICPLHTFYFLVVYASMRVGKDVNHTKWKMRLKMFLIGILIFVIWEFDAIFNVVFFFLPNEPHPGAAVGAYGIKYEWHFRSGLDHYSTFFGMIFALNFPEASLWVKKVENLATAQQYAIKGATGLILLAASAWWATNVLPLPKLEFNTTNPYTFPIPLLTYIFFRNLTPWLRQVHLGFLATIGKYTLETYLMQHHIWLTSNAKTVLVLVPGSPKVNLVVVTGIYFYVARRMYRVTMTTRAMLIPDDPAAAMRNLGGFAGVMGGCSAIAWLIQALDLGWSGVFIAAALCSAFATMTINHLINSTEVRQRVEGYNGHQRSDEIRWHRAVVIAAVGVVLATVGTSILPTVLPTGAPINDGPLRPKFSKPTTESCLETVCEGTWLNLNKQACSSQSGVGCHGESWVWTNHVQEKLCSYKSFDSKTAAMLVSGKHFAFFGDTTTHEVFSATHAIMDPAAGHLTPTTLEDHFSETFVVRIAGASEPVPQGKVEFTGATSAVEMASAINNKGAKSLDVIVLGSWLADAKLNTDPRSYRAAWDKVGSVLAKLNAQCLVVLPPRVVESKLTGVEDSGVVTAVNVDRLRSAVLKSTVMQSCTAIDLVQLTKGREADCIDGLIYQSKVYEVAGQLVLNSINIKTPAPPFPSLKSHGAAKGQGGGVAQSPWRGFLVLVAVGMMLFTMDNYLGISFFFLRVIPPFSPAISWEEATQDLHRKLQVGEFQPLSTNEPEADVEDAVQLVASGESGAQDKASREKH